MKKIAAYLPAWGFYWCGNLIAKLMHYNMEFLYPIYSIVMNWSVFFNDWGGLDVWLEHKSNTENE